MNFLQKTKKSFTENSNNKIFCSNLKKSKTHQLHCVGEK